MKADLIIPIDSLRGKLDDGGYYFRTYRGKQIVQRTPRTWTDTPARKAAREKFIAQYGKRKPKDVNDTRP
jgi:hypothetical protein